MRIDRLEIENFKGFERLSLDLHPQFTLLVGENGTGKTTILDALAVAAGIWLVEPPDSMLQNSRRNILPSEIRLEPQTKGDRVQFQEKRPVIVRATGRIADHKGLQWTRRVRATGGRGTDNSGAKEALQQVRSIYARDTAGQDIVCPLAAYYGAGRAWLPSNRRSTKLKSNGPAKRWAAFYDCFNERIRFAELRAWFSRETIERGNRGGQARPGFEVVQRAILRCIDGADAVWFDTDREQIVLSIQGRSQPFDNLSAGQRMMMALVADLAIKAVTQNAFLLPPDRLGPQDEPWPRVLTQTPGLVLIDELDVHLHPRWQRRVPQDLKSTFPAIQFVCTTHSPQVVGEVRPEEVRILDGREVTIPPRSLGIDSSRILEELMAARARNHEIEALLRRLFALIDKEEFDEARRLLPDVEARLGEDDPEVTRARALMSFLESST